MVNRIDEEQALDTEVEDIKRHLLSLDKDELIDAHEAIESAILGVGQRELPDFLQGKSREAITRARIDMMEVFRASQR